MVNSKDEKANIIWYMGIEITFACGLIFSSFAFVQTFLIELGLNSTYIGLIGFIGQLALAAGYVIFIGDASQNEQIKRRYYKTTLFLCLVPLVLVGVGLISINSGSYRMFFILIVITLATAVQNIGTAYNSILGNRLFIKTINVRYCGQIIGYSGVIGSIIGAGISLFSTRYMEGKGFPTGFYLFFGLSVLFFLAKALFITILKIINNKTDDKSINSVKNICLESRSPLIQIKKLWHNPNSRNLFLPNTLRGFAAAGPFYIMAIGIKNLQFPAVYSNYTAMAVTLGTIAGNILFSASIVKLPSGKVIFAGTIISAGSLIGICLVKTMEGFLILNFFVMIGQILIDNGVPIGVFRNVPEDILGAVTGMRMLLMSAGSALSIVLAGYLLDRFFALPVISLFAIITIISGRLFCKVLAE